jgi:flagellar biosynthetic protein FliP
VLRTLLVVLLALLPALAFATLAGPQATGLPQLSIANVGGEDVSVSLAVLLGMTVLTLLPSLLLACTAFTRIIVVLALLRMAMGTGQTPSNQIMVGLAVFLTMMVMMPVADQAWSAGLSPYLDGTMPFDAAWTATSEPFRAFMLAQIRDTDLITFANLSGHTQGFDSPADVPFGVLVASFITSELKTAFEIGFLIFIPFVVIDLVVASLLMSMGMMMMSPMLVSAPFKILLFVLVDGWVLVVGTLAGSFNPVASMAGAG